MNYTKVSLKPYVELWFYQVEQHSEYQTWDERPRFDLTSYAMQPLTVLDVDMFYFLLALSHLPDLESYCSALIYDAV